MFDVDIGQWLFIAEFQKARVGCCLDYLDGMLYAVGGHDGTDYFSDVEKWTGIPANGKTVQKWTLLDLTLPSRYVHMPCRSSVAKISCDLLPNYSPLFPANLVNTG